MARSLYTFKILSKIHNHSVYVADEEGTLRTLTVEKAAEKLQKFFGEGVEVKYTGHLTNCVIEPDFIF